MFRILSFLATFALVTGNRIPVVPSVFGGDSIFPEGLIVGGKETSIEEHPWQVSLQSYGIHLCGGSIISERIIMTAGHCSSYSASVIQIRTGSIFAESGGSLYNVERILRHEDYEYTTKGVPINDIGLYILETPITFGNRSKPIPLFNQGEVAQIGVMATISGWGSLQENGSTQDRLMTVDIPIVSKAVCNESYVDYGGLPEGQLCAAYPEGGKDSCQGDSGGPLVIDGRQAGIVSWGNGCAREGYPGVYTEISAYRDWITENAGV